MTAGGEFLLDKESRRESYGRVSERGIFISFEGVDGCGKSTQVKELRRRLRGLGDRVLLTRDPGGTQLGEDIRKILQRTLDGPEITARAEMLLFTASRAQLVSEVLQPALEQRKVIIADRFLDSTTVYQGIARGLDRKVVGSINAFAVSDCLPDITFLMDIDPAAARQRLLERGAADRMEKLPESFFRDVREGYLALAAEAPERFFVIDAQEKMSTISDTIWNALTTRYDGFFS